MATTPLSNANLGYISTVINQKSEAEQNVKNTPQISTKFEAKEKSDGFSKALLCLAVVGTLAIQAIGLSKKPANTDVSEQSKLINEGIDALKKVMQDLSKKLDKTPQAPDLSKIDEISKTISGLQEQITKISNDGDETKAFAKALIELQEKISEIQQNPKNPNQIDKTVLEEICTKLSELITTLIEGTNKKIEGVETQVKTSATGIKQAITKAKNETVDATKAASKTASCGVEKITSAIAGLDKKVDDVVVQTEKFESIEEICKAIIKTQEESTEITQEQFSELIDAFNMFIGSKKIPIELVQFKDKVPYIKGSNEMFSGILTKEFKDGSICEMSYVNGRLLQSKKFDSFGNELFQKRYNYRTRKIADKFCYDTSVITSDGSPISKKCTTAKIVNSKGEKINQMVTIGSIDDKKGTFSELSRTTRAGENISLMYLDGDKKIKKTFKSTPEETKMTDLIENAFTIEERPTSAKDPYRYFSFAPIRSQD